MTTEYMPSTGTIHANGVDFSFLEQGTGPLALCMHGYPDSAHTYRHLLPALADAGFRAVAPFNRGYAPTSLAPDGHYEAGVLGVDANALHEALDGTEEAVIIGHDYGAMAAYSAATLAPQRWRRVVAAAVPPGPAVGAGFLVYEQLRMSWYMFFQLTPLAEMVIPANNYEYIHKLWRDWSPGFDGTVDVENFVAAMATHENFVAALTAYRHTLQPELQAPDLADAQAAVFAIPPQPLLYLHGENDGCMSADIARMAPEYMTVDGSSAVIVANAGHFLLLEQPDEVNQLIINFVSIGK